jgi:hypothetical protein
MKPTNGHTELPPRAVARDAVEFLHDVTILAELQGKLLIVDCQQGIHKVVLPTGVLIAGIVLALSCVPVAMAALTLTLMETTSLSPAQSCGTTLLASGVLAAAVIATAIWRLRHGLGLFDRSYREWRQNVQWTRFMLKQLGTKPAGAPPARDSTAGSK